MASNLLTPPTYGKLQFLEDPSESPSTKKCSTHTPEEIALPFLEQIYISELFLPSSIGLAIARPDSRPGYTDCRIRTSGSTFAPISLFHYSKTTYRSDWILLFRRLFRLQDCTSGLRTSAKRQMPRWPRPGSIQTLSSCKAVRLNSKSSQPYIQKPP
jgi:hypothetical protein